MAATSDVFELLSTGVLVLDEHQRLIRLNAAAEALLELSARQCQKLRLSEIWPGAESLALLARRAQETGGALTEHELDLRLPSTRSVTIDCTATPVVDGVSSPTGGAILELIQVERALRISREENLLTQNEIARTVVRGLAHEIRNPLGGIRGAAQLLERELPEPSLREYTNVIIGEADRLRNLLDRLLGPHTLPQLCSINVHEVTERVIALLLAEVADSISIERDYDPSIPVLHADPELMIQALLNVARNAVQAVGESGHVWIRTRIERYATVGTSHHRLAVRIDVEDDGPGVPPGLVDSLFYPLVTGRSQGTGLGLSIAQTLLHQQGGKVEYRPSENTVFSLLIPLDNDL